MSNQLFNKGREGILDRTIDMTGDVRVMLVRSSYTFSNSNTFVADMGAVDNGRSASLDNKTFTSGVFDADDSTITATAAVASKALVIFQHTGDDATARLIAYIDTPASGLPFTPSVGQTVNLRFDAGPNRIFKL